MIPAVQAHALNSTGTATAIRSVAAAANDNAIVSVR